MPKEAKTPNTSAEPRAVAAPDLEIGRVVTDVSIDICERQKQPFANGPHGSPCSPILMTANIGQRSIEMGIAQYDPAALGRPAWNAG